MGCVHGKCCTRYPPSSSNESQSFREVRAIDASGKHMLTQRSLELPSHNFHLDYSVFTQRGYYPDSPDKENQDSFCVRTQIQGNPNLHFFGVFDGHGLLGAQCSNFVKDRLVDIMSSDSTLLDDPVKAFNSAFTATNKDLHRSEIDDSMSGTTAITVLLSGDTLFVANVGDSRAVIAIKDGNRIVAEDLSNDQTPFRKDECERVKLCGARVLTVDQVEGLKDPDIQTWGDEESQGSDPPRLWVRNGMYPGTAFTRSVGDSTAEEIGVVAVPEVSMVQLTSNHLFFVVASDGVFEFLSSQAVVNMAARYSDPRDACAAIAGEAYKLWLEHENRTDDITIIIVQIKDFSNSGVAATDKTGGDKTKPSTITGKGTTDLYYTSGSEVFRAAKSTISDIQPSQHVVFVNRSPAIVAPSPTDERTMGLVGFSSSGMFKITSKHFFL